MIITKKYLKSFSPCENRWKNYLKHYSDFEGSFYEFLCLDKISIEDKHWLINKPHKCKKIQRLQRDYALICSDRATFDSTEEIKEFFMLCAFINVSEMFELRDESAYCSADESAYSSAYRSVDESAYSSAYRSAYWSADSSAYCSAYRSAYWSADSSAYRNADWSANREIQIEIFKSLLEVSDE